MQNWLERFGGCNVIDFKQFWNVTTIITVNNITIIINILGHIVFQLQCRPLNNSLKYTYFFVVI